jgi:glycine dehydrogenase
MLRYLKRLEDSDIALNRSMIALGSCTMKLNATSEMTSISWREFSQPHPFTPVEQMDVI